MLLIKKNKKVVTALLLSLLGFIVGLYTNISPLFQYTSEEFDIVIQNVGSDILIIALFGALFTAVLSFFAYLLGVKIHEKMKIEDKKLNKQGIIYFICACGIIPILILLFDLFFQFPGINVFESWQLALLKVSSVIFYNGMLEELWLRYCLLTLIIFSLHYVFDRENSSIDKKYYKIGLIFLSFLMFFLQLNSLLDMYNFNWPLVLRAVLVSLIPNYLYSKIYLNYGVKYSIIAHCIYIVVTIAILPLMVNLALGL